MFSLPTKQASQRVEIWRKLKRYYTVAGAVFENTVARGPAGCPSISWCSRASLPFSWRPNFSVLSGKSNNRMLNLEWIGARLRPTEFRMIGPRRTSPRKRTLYTRTNVFSVH
jgi:hypothetical protein